VLAFPLLHAGYKPLRDPPTNCCTSSSLSKIDCQIVTPPRSSPRSAAKSPSPSQDLFAMSLGRRASRPSGFPMSKAPLLCTSEPVRGRVLPPTGLAVRLPQPLFSDGSLVDVDEDFSGKWSPLFICCSCSVVCCQNLLMNLQF
jgi:hypothetical protein